MCVCVWERVSGRSGVVLQGLSSLSVSLFLFLSPSVIKKDKKKKKSSMVQTPSPSNNSVGQNKTPEPYSDIYGSGDQIQNFAPASPVLSIAIPLPPTTFYFNLN